MPSQTPRTITVLLQAWSKGNRQAGEELLPLVYAALRSRAERYLRAERREHTLQPTALVHEAYLRLVDQSRVTWQNRSHFFGVAAGMMRRILVDHARGRRAARRGGAWCRVELDDAVGSYESRGVELIALDDALTELAAIDEQQERIVELRFFGGLSIEETAEALGVSPATIKRDWSMARAWLHRRVSVGSS